MNKKLVGLFILLCVLIGASRKYNLFSMDESDKQKVKEYYERLKAAQEDPKAQEQLRERLEKASDLVRRSIKQPGRCPLSKEFIDFLLAGGPITLEAEWADEPVFSPDGTKVATASSNYTAKLWDANTGQLLRTLAEHTRSVVSVVFSPDSSKLATGSNDKTVKLWDVNTGKLLRTLAGHTDSVRSIAFSPDGSKLATGSSDKTATIWDTNTGDLLRPLDGYKGSVIRVAFNPDGSKLATVSIDRIDGAAQLWDANTGDLLNTFFYQGYFRVLSPDVSKIVTGSGEIRLSNLNTGQLLYILADTQNTESVAFSPDGNKLAIGSWDDTAKIWDVNTGDLLHTLTGHEFRIGSIAFSPDGSKIATGSGDDTAKIWDVNTGDLLNTLVGHTDEISSVVFSPDGSKIATRSWDGITKIWNMQRLDKLAKLRKEERKQKGKKLNPGFGKKVSLQRFFKVLPDEECEKDPDYCNIMSVEQCELLQVFEDTFQMEEPGWFGWLIGNKKRPVGRIQATPAQWQTFKTLPDVLQEILRVRIKAPGE